MSRQRKAELRPYKQGELDALCGVYAVVNGVRVVTAPHLHLPRSAAVDLFAELTSKAVGRKFLREAIVEGMTPKDLAPLLDRAQIWLRKNYDICLHVEQPFPRGSTVSRLSLYRVLEHLEVPGAAAIVSTRVHWTVAVSATERRLYLLDSNGRRYLRLQQDDDGGAGPIWSRGTFLLSAEPYVRPLSIHDQPKTNEATPP
jgi:hypothetical protein